MTAAMTIVRSGACTRCGRSRRRRRGLDVYYLGYEQQSWPDSTKAPHASIVIR